MKHILEVCLTTVGYSQTPKWISKGMGNCHGYVMGCILASKISLPSQKRKSKWTSETQSTIY